MNLTLTLMLALLLSLVLVPVIRLAGRRSGYVAIPREDRWHHQPTPSLGGVGIFLAFLLSLLVSAAYSAGWSQVRWELLAGSSLVFLIGVYDDIRRISPAAKLVGQILAAAIVVFLGYTTGFFTPRIPNNILAQVPNSLLTFVWLVGITNAINLLDNMDGLAGGISVIAAGILSFFFWKNGNQDLLVISLTLMGSALGFLVFNFPPASIFMGDSGSQFLGFTLAVLAISRSTPQASNVFAVMGVPTILFLLPIFDTILVTFTRLLRGQSPTQGGRDHTSHRLVAFGLTERQAVLVLYGVALASGVVATVLESLDYDLSLVLVPLLILSLALITAYLGRLKVVTSTSQARYRTIARLMFELTYKRRLLEIILDFILISVAYYLAFFTLNGLSMSNVLLEKYLNTLPIVLIATYTSFITFGVYRGVWQYVGVGDLVNFAKAVASSVMLSAAGVFFLFPQGEYLPGIFILLTLFLYLGLASSRSSFRILDMISGRRVKAREERVLICGAGDAGEMAVRWIQMNPQLGYRTIGFLDQDPYHVGRQIHGLEIFGGFEKLESLINDKKVDGIVISSSQLLSQAEIQEAISVARARGCWVRSLRLEFESIE